MTSEDSDLEQSQEKVFQFEYDGDKNKKST